MKTTIFAVMFALIGLNAAVAADHNSANVIPTPNQLVETELLPKFNAKVKMEAKGWGLKCESEQGQSNVLAKSRNQRSLPPKENSPKTTRFRT